MKNAHLPLILCACLLLTSHPADAKGPRKFRVLKGHDNFITQIVLAPKLMATASQDATVRLWKLPAGRPQTVIKAGEDETFGLIALSPKGDHLAISVDSAIHVYAIAKKKAKKVFQLKGHKKEIQALAIDAGGTTLISVSDGVRLWSLTTGKEIGKVAGDKAATYVVFPPGSSDFAVLLADGLHFYSRSTFKETRKLAMKNIRRVAFSSDGALLAATTKDSTLDIYTAKGAKLWSQPKLSDDSYAVFTQDKKTVIAGFENTKLVGLNARTGKMQWFITGDAGLAILDLQGKVLATAANESRIWLWRIR